MIEQKICDAIEIIVNRAISKAKYNRVIKVKILDNIDNKKYRVKYQDNIFYAYSIGQDKYEKEDFVYILIPNNNMDESKFILGK